MGKSFLICHQDTNIVFFILIFRKYDIIITVIFKIVFEGRKLFLLQESICGVVHKRNFHILQSIGFDPITKLLSRSSLLTIWSELISSVMEINSYRAPGCHWVHWKTLFSEECFMYCLLSWELKGRGHNWHTPPTKYVWRNCLNRALHLKPGGVS